MPSIAIPDLTDLIRRERIAERGARSPPGDFRAPKYSK